MKIMIASDVHGSSYYAEKIKSTFEKKGRNFWCFWAIYTTPVRAIP